MNNPDRTTEEANAADKPPLEPAARKHLQNLIDEAMDMHIALSRLSEAEMEHHENCYAAFKELHRAMGSLLAFVSVFSFAKRWGAFAAWPTG